MDKKIVVYQSDDNVRLEVQTDGETVWLTLGQMSQLFGRDASVIGKHVRNVFAEGELPEEGFRQILPKNGKGRPETIFALDVVISVGYRVKSLQGTRFRQWATRILREMLLRRYEELKDLVRLEKRVDVLEGDVVQIRQGMRHLVQQVSVPPAQPHAGRSVLGWTRAGSRRKRNAKRRLPAGGRGKEKRKWPERIACRYPTGPTTSRRAS